MTLEIRLVLAALSVYRLAQLVAIDDGPGDCFRRLRAYLGMHEDEKVRTVLGGLVHCPYCLGLYLALPVAACVLYPWWVSDIVLVVLGIAGAQATLQGARDAEG